MLLLVLRRTCTRRLFSTSPPPAAAAAADAAPPPLVNPEGPGVQDASTVKGWYRRALREARQHPHAGASRLLRSECRVLFRESERLFREQREVLLARAAEIHGEDPAGGDEEGRYWVRETDTLEEHRAKERWREQRREQVRSSWRSPEVVEAEVELGERRVQRLLHFVEKSRFPGTLEWQVVRRALQRRLGLGLGREREEEEEEEGVQEEVEEKGDAQKEEAGILALSRLRRMERQEELAEQAEREKRRRAVEARDSAIEVIHRQLAREEQERKREQQEGLDAPAEWEWRRGAWVPVDPLVPTAKEKGEEEEKKEEEAASSSSSSSSSPGQQQPGGRNFLRELDSERAEHQGAAGGRRHREEEMVLGAVTAEEGRGDGGGKGSVQAQGRGGGGDFRGARERVTRLVDGRLGWLVASGDGEGGQGPDAEEREDEENGGRGTPWDTV